MEGKLIHIQDYKSKKQQPRADLRILMLEDNPSDAELIQYELKEAGFSYTAIIVETEEAYEKALQEFTPDLILSDYDLPLYSGVQALAFAKKVFPEIPFILVTGAVTEDRAIEVLTSGARDYVLKHRLHRLAPAVERALAEAEDHKARKAAEEELRKSHALLEQKVAERTAELERAKSDAELKKQRLQEVLEAFPPGRDQTTGSVKRMYRLIVSTAALLTFFLAALHLTGLKTAPMMAALPWFIPVISLFQSLALFSVAFLALGRYKVLRDPGSFWIGAGTAGYGVALAFYALTWPGLLQNGGSIIAGLPGTPAWFVQLGATIFSTFLLAAVLLHSPRNEALAGSRLVSTSSAWVFSLIVSFALVVNFEQYLPVLVSKSGAFTLPLLAWNAALAVLFAGGAVLSTRKYLKSSDPLLGYIALTQVVYAFSIFAAASGMRRYDLWWYVLRIILPGTSLFVLFGLLSEYVQLFRREREKTSEVLRAEEALGKSERTLKKVQEIAHLGSWEMDLVSNRLSWSDEVYWIFGLQPQEFGATYEAFLDHVHPDDRESVDAAYAGSIRENRDTYEIEHRVVRRSDGEVRIIHEKCEHIRDESGRIIRSIGMVHDITEFRRAEEALQEATEEANCRAEEAEEGRRTLNALMEHIPMGITIAEAPDVRIREVSRYGRELTGRGADEIEDISVDLHTQVWQIYRADGLTPASNEELPLTRATQNGEVITGEEFVISRPDGTKIPILCTAAPIRDASGYVTGGVIGWQDITERKRAEQALRESEQRYRTLFDSIDEGYCVIEMRIEPDKPLDYCFLEINQAFERQSTLVNAKGRWMREMRPEHEESWFEIYRDVALTGKPIRFEHSGRALEGRWFTLYAFRVGPPEQRRVAILFNDITERKRAEEDLKKSTTELEYANKELESFSYSVSHDLRAPLRAIDGFSRMLLTQEQGFDEETKRRIHRIRENVVKMDRLINDLLYFSRSGRTPISSRKIDMDGLTDEVWQEQVSANPDRKMELQKGKLPQAFGDESLIHQVLSNLLENAVKFSRGKKNPLIEIGGKSEGKELVYFIKDNGTGFDMKYYDKLFGVFQRLHPESEYEGTGVGLAIVQRIIHRHGGRVWAEGEVGKGATFFFSLPTA